ncbi:holin family protein [Pseudooceanicola sp.]|uniref:holin family protein n=1 Tax=Pseudooceanicola sp. TaxID=1914328 RepID=UPI0035C67504
MGLISTLLDTLFGGRTNRLRETIEVFTENAEKAGVRDLDRLSAALSQHAAEFRTTRSPFDALIDGINRLPRPMLAFGTIGLFVSAMTNPVWFAERMQGLALVPEALWWLMGAVVSFYFGARHQLKGQQFQRDIAQTLARVPRVVDNTRALRRLDTDPVDHTEPATPPADGAPRIPQSDDGAPNAALDAWRASRTG